jgi:hypothetical protein
LLFFVFWYPPLRYSEAVTAHLSADSLNLGNYFDTIHVSENSLKSEIVLEGYKKAITEIAARNEHGYSWFHFKFVVVGAILSVIGFSVFKEKWRDQYELINSDLFYILLSICTIFSLNIDIQIRQNVLATNQLRLWIANFIEPYVNNIIFIQGNINHASQPYYIGWEQILRISGEQSGFQMDSLYSFIYWPTMHILTRILYISYVFLCFNQGRIYEGYRNVKFFLFFAVNISIVVYAIMGTALPSIIEVNIMPFGNEKYVLPWKAALIFGGCGALILIFNYIALYLVGRNNRPYNKFQV